MPYLRSYGLLFFVQQFLSTLLVMMHFGIFGLYLGGPTQMQIFGYDDPPKNASFSNEWAGLIGQNFNEFRMAPWAVFAPVICFFIVILIVNMMKKEIEENITGIQGVKKKVMKKKEIPLPHEIKTARAFEFVERVES
ncbi:hypothetical protein BIV60_10825 [Bacillus sp. MUM 116]|uniref:hypothetical protein n=1 Tax=Bacillus sp. MUM 116 TaxID=1678002 RepID=UPI0008F5DEAE|nr:hypothetical protein [Bacillus sp. MUM 116]OIK15016.1 hypothetical protein BIV60_10825 [Bacillus sp. MUM 116]